MLNPGTLRWDVCALPTKPYSCPTLASVRTWPSPCCSFASTLRYNAMFALPVGPRLYYHDSVSSYLFPRVSLNCSEHAHRNLFLFEFPSN